jgi:hypothetical protein
MYDHDDILRIGDFTRNVVAVLGDFKFSTAVFLERRLVVQQESLESIRETYATCRAIIIADHPSRFGFITECIDALLPEAENHGIAIRILLHTESDVDIATRKFRDKLGSENFTLITQLTGLAEEVARYSAGPPVGKCVIDGIDKIEKFDDDCLLLLRRAFYDCKKIHVEPIHGGKDSSHLLKVYAWLDRSDIKSGLLPFFAKISEPEKIRIEKERYRSYTDLFISFQYRPNCRIERCVSIKTKALLVGNFVEDASPLRDTLKDSHQTGIIYSLFEKSLKGFRRQPFVAKANEAAGNLRTFVEGRIWVEKLVERTDVIQRARELGLREDVHELANRLLDRCSLSSCITSPIHGDLHSGNVMVRGGDAILIDFSAVTASGPLTADPATLEISLSFNVGSDLPIIKSGADQENEDKKFFQKWQDFIDTVYNPSQLLQPMAITDQVPDEFSWLRRAIREIRHILIGCDCTEEEIMVVIACYLMRLARVCSQDRTERKDRFDFDLHAYALVIAERIIKHLEKNINNKKP